MRIKSFLFLFISTNNSYYYSATSPVSKSVILTSSNFTSTLDGGPLFIKFYAHWCRHSKELGPKWKTFSDNNHDRYKDLYGLTIGEVECSSEIVLCDKYKVDGYPTILLINSDKTIEYEGNFDDDKEPVKYIEKNVQLKPPSGKVIKLTPSNIKLYTANKLWTIKHYSPLCPHCQQLKPIYIEFAKQMEKRVYVGELDCLMYQEYCSKLGINAVPTIKILEDGIKKDEIIGVVPISSIKEKINKFLTPETIVGDSNTLERILEKNKVAIIIYSNKNENKDNEFPKHITSKLKGIEIIQPLLFTTDIRIAQKYKIKTKKKSILLVKSTANNKKNIFKILDNSIIENIEELKKTLKNNMFPIVFNISDSDGTTMDIERARLSSKVILNIKQNNNDDSNEIEKIATEYFENKDINLSSSVPIIFAQINKESEYLNELNTKENNIQFLILSNNTVFTKYKNNEIKQSDIKNILSDLENKKVQSFSDTTDSKVMQNNGLPWGWIIIVCGFALLVYFVIKKLKGSSSDTRYHKVE